MVISYDNRKKSYDSMDDSQKQQYNDMLKNKGDDYVGNQYMKQYNQQTNNNQQQTSNESNFNNGDGTNGQNKDIKPFPELEKEKPVPNNQIPNQNFNQNVSPELDQSKFQQDPGKITVQEGTAQQTGKPDYGISTDARLNEMKGNLDHYFATSPRMFSDRETFNKVFEYNGRESDAQRQLLDSYWKRKEDMDKSSQYTSGESIMNGLDNSEITTDQLNLIKDTNPEAYRKRQQLQEEEIKKRIVNSIVPPLLEEISQNMINMMNNLGIQPQDALDIEGVYNDTMERTGAWQTMEDANRTVRRIEEVNNKRTAIMNRYAASTGGTVSDALAAARMQKALAPYNTEMQGLQYQYQDYANLYSQKQAAAYQAAQVRQAQAQENQRIWNQRVTALGFAADALNWRTPEQKAQLELQTKSIENEMSLLQQSRENDLSLYNKYATAKLQNQLNSELTDLSVTDPTQLRANLNNVLSSYYSQWGDIIKRPQAEVVEDVLAYAQKNGVSVAEALRKNFIEPLQSKQEYKNKIASNYAAPKAENSGYTKITLNGKDYLLKDGEFVDPSILNSSNYTPVPESKMLNGLEAFKSKMQSLVDTGSPIRQGWCGEPVNDYLASIGSSVQYDNAKQTKIDSITPGAGPKVGSIAIWDGSTLNTENGKKYGHVAIVTGVDEQNGTITVLESNGKNQKMGMAYATYKMANVTGYYDPSAGSSTNTNYDKKNPYSGVSGYTSSGSEINAGGWITSLESSYESKLTNDERKGIRESYGIDDKEYNEQKTRYLAYVEKTQVRDQLQQLVDMADEIISYETTIGDTDYHEGLWDNATIYQIDEPGTDKGFDSWYNLFGESGASKEYLMFKNFMNNASFQKYLDMREKGANFGVMTNSEWNKVDMSTAPITWGMNKSTFVDAMTDYRDKYKEVLAELDKEYGMGTETEDKEETPPDMSDMQSPIGGSYTGSVTDQGGLLTKYVQLDDGTWIMKVSYDGGLSRQ